MAQSPAPQVPRALGPPSAITLDFGHLKGNLQGDLLHSHYDITGGVRMHANDTTLRADSLHVDGPDRLGFSENAFLTRRPFTVRAKRIGFDPNGLTAEHASVTTAKPDEKPDIELRVGSLSVRPLHKAGQTQAQSDRVVLHNVSLYLLHNHILTLPSLATTIKRQVSGEARRQGPHPTVGYSGRYGIFVGYGSSANIAGAPLQYSLTLPLRQSPQVRVTSRQTLLSGPAIRPEIPFPAEAPVGPNAAMTAFRALTTAPRPLLPEADPLLFHDFLPDPNPIRLFDQPTHANVTANEELSYHVETTGRGRNDLYVSRTPEVALSGSLPLTHAYALPAPGDPAAFRHYLRHLVLSAGMSVSVGKYQEQPTGIQASRVRYVFQLSTRPLLVAPNTVVLPTYSFTTNRYTGIGPLHTDGGMQYIGSGTGRAFSGDMYSYSQFSLALNHYFNPYSAAGIQYIVSQPGGDSPFNFDVPDTTREFDARVQGGNHRLAVAGSIRYDVLHPHVIDYTLAIAPGLHGFTPVFSYRFFSRAFGIGIEIPGLTF